MMREYDAALELQEYRSGLLINGEYEWIGAVTAIRQHLRIQPGVSVSFFCGRQIIGSGRVLSLYEKHKDSDGILYIQFMRLETYG